MQNRCKNRFQNTNASNQGSFSQKLTKTEPRKEKQVSKLVIWVSNILKSHKGMKRNKRSHKRRGLKVTTLKKEGKITKTGTFSLIIQNRLGKMGRIHQQPNSIVKRKKREQKKQKKDQEKRKTDFFHKIQVQKHKRNMGRKARKTHSRFRRRRIKKNNP